MDFENRIVASEIVTEEAEFEKGIRPRSLDEYIGQEKAKGNLEIFIQAAKKRSEREGISVLFCPGPYFSSIYFLNCFANAGEKSAVSCFS